MLDIYFDENYAKLYEDNEKGKSVVFEYKSENGKVRNLFIKKEIPWKLDDGRTYYDIVTPYGYGGPVVLECSGDKNKLIEGYMESFAKYCQENDIVSEFIRFHPLVNNADDFRGYMRVEDIRHTVGTNLLIAEDPLNKEFSKSCRKNIRHALKNGVSFVIEEYPDDIQEFKEFYYKTMDRNNATDYYYFDEKYFSDLVKYFKNNIVCVKVFYDGKPIAMNICFAYGGYVHIHLSGSITEYLHVRPTYVMRHAICTWAHEHGYKFVHHGGGRSNDEHDKLFEFKKQFGLNTQFMFSVGKMTWNESIYNRLVEKRGYNVEEDDGGFFPAYRR